MDPRIKEAFDKVRGDIMDLSKEFYALSLEIDSLKRSTDDKIAFSIVHIKELLNEKLNNIEKNLNLTIDRGINEIKTLSQHQMLVQGRQSSLEQQQTPFQQLITPVPTHNPTHQPQNTTDKPITPTHPTPLEALRSLNTAFSSGNRGVPTDRPTDRPTDTLGITLINSMPINLQTKKANDFDEAVRVLDTLDGIKKEIRRKFKQLTPMEFQVFSLLYSLEEGGEDPDYRLIAVKLGLSESSIRDYIGRIVAKGIPLTKEKINNKKIILRISPDLKKIASLDTIMKLIEL